MHSRLFYNAGRNKLDVGKVEELVKRMLEIGQVSGTESNIPAGYTYLGQMIAHDIVPSTNKKGERDFGVRANLVLDSLYGDSGYRERNQIVNQLGEFIFSDAQCDCKKKCICNNKDMDILRDTNGVIIPDKRNDENLLISQLHLFWQKLHNVIIKNFIPTLECSKLMCVEEKFRITRSLVVKIFQQIVLEDYLYNILDLDVYKAYMHDGKAQTIFEVDDYYNNNKVPLEFSHAAFRFGHSMVRDSYDINSHVTIKLDKLLIQNHASNIKASEVVNWRMFFGEQKKLGAQKAFRIDHRIDEKMKNIPGHDRVSITKLNIEAGNNVSLASGMQILKCIQKNFRNEAKLLKLDECQYKDHYVFSDENIAIYNEHYCDDSGNYIVEPDKLPLWVYILLESSLTSDQRLGKLGSVIVAESIMMSIKQSRPTIFSIKTESETYGKISRFNASFISDAKTADEIFNGMLDEFRRFTMIGLINFIEKFD